MKKRLVLLLAVSFALVLCGGVRTASAEDGKIRVAVITGNHSFDLPNFYQMFRGLDGVDVYPQHLENFASSTQDVRDSYDVVVFFNMHGPVSPKDEGSPWWAGKPNAALQRLFEQGQGIVVLHHGLLAWREWDVWSETVGFNGRGFKYKPEITMNIKVAVKDHPITKNLSDFTIKDEGYILNGAFDGKGEVILTTQHENAMKEVGWVRKRGNSKIFCLALGHDNLAWANDGFQKVMLQGIQWCAKKK